MGIFSKSNVPSPAKPLKVSDVAIDEAGTTANKRVSDLDPNSKWPSPSPGPPSSPRTARRKIKAVLKDNNQPCDIIKGSDDTTTNSHFEKRGWDMSVKPGDKADLGSGGFGNVITIYGPRLERASLDVEEAGASDESKIKYACKIIDATGKYEKRLREFGNELMGLNAGHSHPNIIQLFDAFIIQRNIDFKFYIVLEHGDGGNLKRHTIKNGPLEESRSRRFFQQIGSAVNFLHAQNIAHRDLKMQNVILKLEKDPKTGKIRKCCKLIDFGLSEKCYSEEKGPKMLTGVAGTRHAMAPEILQNEVRKGSLLYNPIPADVWALGVMLYEMLTRVLPYNTVDVGVMLDLQKRRNLSFKRKLSERKKKVNEKLPSLTDEAKHLVRMMLDPDPVARWTWWEICRHPWMQRGRSAASTPDQFSFPWSSAHRHTSSPAAAASSSSSSSSSAQTASQDVLSKREK